MGDIRVGGSALPQYGADTQASKTVTVKPDDTLAQIAQDQGVEVSDLLAANPQISDPDHLNAGMEIQVPPRNSGSPSSAKTGGSSGPAKPQAGGAKRAEASLDSIAMRGMLIAHSFGSSASSASAASASSGKETAETPVDPRFSKFNEAFQAGDGEKATSAANELLTQLQAEKPPQPALINQARMSLAAGAMLKGDLSQAQKALLAIDPRKLGDADRQQFNELRDLLADAHRQGFSDSMKSDSSDNAAAAKDRGKAASGQAKELLELLQKTDPSNTTAISDTRLKLANAQLMGGNYRDAEKTLTGINEKQLGPEAKQYLGAIRDEMHAQQIDALGSAYASDMKQKKYKDAASNATAMVNDLAKNFPDAKGQIVTARLQQATAQIMGDDMTAARTSLAHVNRDDLKQMPKEVQDRFGELNTAVTKHFDAVKKMDALKAEQAEIEKQVKTIDTLTTSGDKAKAQQAVPLAEKLVATIQQKYPDNTKAIEGAKLTLANAKLEAGDRPGAMSDLQAIAANTKDPAVKDQAQLFQARATLQGGETDKGVKMLRDLSNTAETPEIRKAAKGVIISIETGYLKNVEQKAGLEQKRLEAIKVEKDPSGWSLFNPVTAVKFISHGYDNLLEDHERNMNYLGVVGSGANDLTIAMKKNGLTLDEISKMNFNQLAALPGVGQQSAREIQIALKNVDVQTINKDSFQGKNFSWENNTWYVDASYLDTEMDKVAKWVGDQVRGARNYDETLKKSDSLFERAVGYASAGILDGVSAANSFVKEQIKTAEDFYNDPSRKDAWYSKLGRAGTFGADVLASTFTMPATIADYKATDAERAGAITGTLLMVGTAGVLKAGGPAWESLGAGASRAGSRIASTRLAQTLAKSEFGQWAGRTAEKIGEKAVKLEEKFEAPGVAKGADKIKASFGKVEKAFEETSFAKRVDRIKAGLGTDVKLGGSKAVGGGAAEGAGTLEIHPKMSNVMFDNGIKEFNMDKIMKELDRTAEGSRIADRIRSGELHVTVSREPIAPEIDGMARPAANEIYVKWGGSIEETTSTMIHEGVHTMDPTEVIGGQASREAIAREAEYDYRMKAGLKYMDPPDYGEQVYRDTFTSAKNRGLSDREAHIAADKELAKALREDEFYGQGQAGPAGQARKVRGPAAPEDAARINELNKWVSDRKITGDVPGLRERLHLGDAEARAEFEEFKADIAKGKRPNVEDYEDNLRTEAPKWERISDANKKELEDSDWLKKKVPGDDDRRNFMKWLEKNHKAGEEHAHLNPGSPYAEKMLQRWLEEEGLRKKP